MLTDPDGIDADLVGKHRLLNQVADDLRGVKRLAVGSVRDIAERVEAKLDRLSHAALLSAPRTLRHPGKWATGSHPPAFTITADSVPARAPSACGGPRIAPVSDGGCAGGGKWTTTIPSPRPSSPAFGRTARSCAISKRRACASACKSTR